ncbi:MAG: radical SAM protein [Alphaproteobacteria bacterium]|nr:radical SAM protein [Alphaproteobacteria bacterium]
MRELCWNVTTKCNQNCGYCLRFMNIPDQSKQNNLQILHNLADCGITELTWGGGEPMVYPHIQTLLKEAYRLGIKNKVVSNGGLLTNNRIDEIAQYLDTLTLSLDSTNAKTNEILGRGYKHYDNVVEIIDRIKEQGYPINLKINTVACSYNKDEFPELMRFVDRHASSWRIFKMMPVRERAVVNYDRFQISKECFDGIKAFLQKNTVHSQLSFRESEDMENKYLLLVANGDIFCTENGVDVRKGSALDIKALSRELNERGR